MAFLDSDAATDQALVLLGAVAFDDFVLLGDELAEVEPERRAFQTGITRVSRVVEQFRGFNEVLGRQAAAVRAGATHHPLLRHDSRLAHLLGAKRRREGRRAGSQDEEIDFRDRHWFAGAPSEGCRSSRPSASLANASPSNRGAGTAGPSWCIQKSGVGGSAPQRAPGP